MSFTGAKWLLSALSLMTGIGLTSFDATSAWQKLEMRGMTEQLRHIWNQMYPGGDNIPPPANGYTTQVFSRDPLVIYIHDFVSPQEIEHLVRISEPIFEPSMIYPSGQPHFDSKQRVSETAEVERDAIVRRIEARARRFQGWRGNSTKLQRLRTQRYHVGGFYTFHYDWDPTLTEGNRVTTFMVYLAAECTGGGTNFPRLEMPEDDRWCSVVDCEDYEYQGVTFKPMPGSAVFWENMYPNGTLHKGVRHASLPVKSGTKIGLNIWSWDTNWRPDGVV